jgi:hypothetical protein
LNPHFQIEFLQHRLDVFRHLHYCGFQRAEHALEDWLLLAQSHLARRLMFWRNWALPAPAG